MENGLSCLISLEKMGKTLFTNILWDKGKISVNRLQIPELHTIIMIQGTGTDLLSGPVFAYEKDPNEYLKCKSDCGPLCGSKRKNTSSQPSCITTCYMYIFKTQK